MKRIIISIFCVIAVASATAQSAYDNAPVKNRVGAEVPAIDTTSLNLISGLPIEVINDSTVSDLFQKPSLRRDDAIEYDSLDLLQAKPLVYEKLYSKDVLFRARVWREISGRDSVNRPYFFRNTYFSEDGDKNFITVLLKAIKNDSIQAFAGIDDRFTTPISFSEAMSAFQAKTDTVASYDLDGNISGYQVRQRAINLDSVYRFRIKEDWVFSKKSGKMYVRILGIAPLVSFTSSDGIKYGNSESPAFWIYYPDLRKVLVNKKASNPLKIGNTITWEEIFENRLFSSHIVRSSLDQSQGYSKYPLTDQESQHIQEILDQYKTQIFTSN